MKARRVGLVLGLLMAAFAFTSVGADAAQADWGRRGYRHGYRSHRGPVYRSTYYSRGYCAPRYYAPRYCAPRHRGFSIGFSYGPRYYRSHCGW